MSQTFNLAHSLLQSAHLFKKNTICIYILIEENMASIEVIYIILQIPNAVINIVEFSVSTVNGASPHEPPIAPAIEACRKTVARPAA